MFVNEFNQVKYKAQLVLMMMIYNNANFSDVHLTAVRILNSLFYCYQYHYIINQFIIEVYFFSFYAHILNHIIRLCINVRLQFWLFIILGALCLLIQRQYVTQRYCALHRETLHYTERLCVTQRDSTLHREILRNTKRLPERRCISQRLRVTPKE